MKYLLLSLGLLPAAVAAQTADSAAAAAPAAAAPAAASVPGVRRASWLSDRQALQVGDILTIVVDEQTAASERVSTTASANRGQKAALNAGIGSNKLGPEKGFGTGHDASSRDVGEARREGDLVAVLSVRIVGLEPNGYARIQGTKSVTVDGRTQTVSLTGLVRPDDVTSANTVQSARVADAVIDYKGKKIGPRQGILGKILSILWP